MNFIQMSLYFLQSYLAVNKRMDVGLKSSGVQKGKYCPKDVDLENNLDKKSQEN